jgi:glycosyltransferase involved in cell wall biosynthesis
MRILFAVRNDGADAYFRAIAPASMLRFQGIECEARAITPDDADDFDVLVLQRHCSPIAELVMRIFQEKGKLVVYDTDDWLFGIPPFWPAYDDYFNRGQMTPTGLLSVHERLLRQADLVTCTVPTLAERMSAYNDNIKILPNCVMWADWDIVAPKEAPGPVVGWFGMPYYWDTWKLIAPSVEKALREVDGYLSILGYPEVVNCFSDWLRSRTFVEPMCLWRNFAQMRGLISSFDVGLAWLEDTPFNRCKSPLKALQYGAAGVPIVASPVVYGDILSDGYPGEFGTLVEDPTQLDWAIKDALEDVVDGRSSQKLVASRFRARVWKHHTYETQWTRWLEVYQEALDAAS